MYYWALYVCVCTCACVRACMCVHGERGSPAAWEQCVHIFLTYKLILETCCQVLCGLAKMRRSTLGLKIFVENGYFWI